MSFEPIKSSLMMAAQKYSLGKQAEASLVCRKVSQMFKNSYSTYAHAWTPQKYESGVLFVRAGDSSASSDLFLRLHDILNDLAKIEMPPVQEIRIVRR